MPEELPARWRERAEYLRRYGDSNTARLWTLAAEELEAALKIGGLAFLGGKKRRGEASGRSSGT